MDVNTFHVTCQNKQRAIYVTCSQGHKLPVKYWGEDCPICRLIHTAEIALEDGEWALLDSRDKFEEALNEVKRMNA